MDYLGLFCLGAFVGTIATLGLHRVNSIQDWQAVIAFTLPAVLSGAAMVLVDRFAYSPAFGCYPLGLVAALMWAYIRVAVDNWNSSSPRLKLLGGLHLSAAILVSSAGAVIAIIPAYLQLRAETSISPQARVDILMKHHQRAATLPLPAVDDKSGSAAEGTADRSAH